jgi:glucose/arabinose dehydrogenase
MLKLLKFILALLMTFTVIVGVGNVFANYLKTQQANEKIKALKLPKDFNIQVFAGHTSEQKLDGARLMTVGPDGHLYLSLPKQGKVVMLPDENQDGVADKIVLVAEKLNAPHGIVFVDNTLFVANQDGVVKLERENGQWPAIKTVTIVQNLATGGHTLKSLKRGPDGFLYLNVGSSCNVCVEEDSTRATIHRYSVDGKAAGSLLTLGRHAQSPIWASGLRNSQGFVWHPVTGEMFATNEGADNRSEFKNGRVNDELPPEHLNKIIGGQHYGWPFCWGKEPDGSQFADPNFEGEANFCKTTQAPAITFTSHSTPIGISFLNEAKIAAAYKNDALVALHGSWNREKLSGYKVVRVKFNEAHQPIAVEDFLTGWLQNNGAWGRPVDVTVGNDGAIYVSDDKMGLIYRVTQAPSS